MLDCERDGGEGLRSNAAGRGREHYRAGYSADNEKGSLFCVLLFTFLSSGVAIKNFWEGCNFPSNPDVIVRCFYGC